ncbi:MAG: DNA polymerase III subunit gamma/tau [Firmicutes bacterium]|nr:DNA polymerase III subunit gamma/tau [Bacillota bacterium]
MSYQALYRQWRPLDFDEIIGQNHIVVPLKNQLLSNTYGHAYIFSGTRGTGKTSTAKIFARAVNCLNNTNGNPCNQCENCLSIIEDQFIDVVEMDAASNNSVDDIRELREHIKFAPSKGKFKVYIIDEVHMLSQGAFNALLKTLEEPPEYVLFILATTELHKIPATILSRCQRFDFKRVSFEEILSRLEYICKKINIEYDVEALKLIIQKSDGAVRDTLSALDQCISIGEGKLSISGVVNVLGIVEKTQILTLIQFIESDQPSEALLTVDNIISQGKDLNQFTSSMIEVYRDIMILRMVKEHHASLIDASDEYIESIREISTQLTPTHLSRALDELINLSKVLKYAQNKRALFESTLIKLMFPETEENIKGIIERIEKIEAKLLKGFSTAPSPQVSKPVSEPIPVTPSQDIEPFIEFTEIDITLETIIDQWPTFLSKVSNEKKGLVPVIHDSIPIKFSNDRCVVALTPDSKMFTAMLSNPSNATYMNQTISSLVKHNIQLEFEVAEEHIKENDKEAQIKKYFKDFEDVLEIK